MCLRIPVGSFFAPMCFFTRIYFPFFINFFIVRLVMDHENKRFRLPKPKREYMCTCYINISDTCRVHRVKIQNLDVRWKLENLKNILSSSKKESV